MSHLVLNVCDMNIQNKTVYGERIGDLLPVLVAFRDAADEGFGIRMRMLSCVYAC
jgi:hypothetical protein